MSSKRKSPPTKHEGENATLEKCFEQVNNTSIDMKLEKNGLSFAELSLKKQRTNASTDISECITTKLPFEHQQSSADFEPFNSSIASIQEKERLNNNDENTVNNNQNKSSSFNSDMKSDVIDISNPINTTENLLISLSLGLVGSNFIPHPHKQQHQPDERHLVASDNVINNSKQKENSISDTDNVKR
jgi:hypothetical protein